MTPRSLFTIVSKIIGLLFIKDILEAIPQFLYSISAGTQYASADETIWSLIFTLLSIAVYMYAAHYFIFKTNTLIDKLKLDKNFAQDDFPLNIHRSTVLSIVVMVIGGLLIADNVPLLCRSAYLYYQKWLITKGSGNNPDLGYIIVYSSKILIGLILAGNQQLFVNYIERKRKATVVATEEKTEMPE